MEWVTAVCMLLFGLQRAYSSQIRREVVTVDTENIVQLSGRW